MSILFWSAAIWLSLGLLGALTLLVESLWFAGLDAFSGRRRDWLFGFGAAVIGGPIGLACVILVLWEASQELRRLREKWKEIR